MPNIVCLCVQKARRDSVKRVRMLSSVNQNKVSLSTKILLQKLRINVSDYFWGAVSDLQQPSEHHKKNSTSGSVPSKMAQCEEQLSTKMIGLTTRPYILAFPYPTLVWWQCRRWQIILQVWSLAFVCGGSSTDFILKQSFLFHIVWGKPERLM